MEAQYYISRRLQHELSLQLGTCTGMSQAGTANNAHMQGLIINGKSLFGVF